MSVMTDEAAGLIRPVTVPDWITVASPAAGANAVIPSGRGYYMRVLAVRAKLVTDANVANRQVSLDYGPGSGLAYVRNMPTTLIAASTTVADIHWSPAVSVWDSAAGASLVIPLLPLWLPSGVTAQITVDNIQATDALTNIRAVVEYGDAVA